MSKRPKLGLFLSGFIATFVVTAMAYPALAAFLKATTGGTERSPVFWIALLVHFLAGSFILPLAFESVAPLLGKVRVIQGLLFGVLLALLSVSLSLPLLAFGGFSTGAPTPGLVLLASSIFNVLYGVLLGAVISPMQNPR